ncbi:hypothetical protein [Kribbella sp. NPDC051770]|uniref:hypothetical protein n=1 Tax=Kribbella sp. NPDC051770 TaxID=3155413 RepID=UPI0034393534
MHLTQVRRTAAIGVLAALTLTGTAVTARAAVPDGITLVGKAGALCRYQVNHPGGIYIYEQNTVGRTLGSLANGILFDANCTNGTGEGYVDCGSNNLWKAVTVAGGRTGYVKTKCLIRR